jgi:hypothetical protein
MDTRVRVFLLFDYKGYYGVEKTLEDAENLIRNISSITLLDCISRFSVGTYLHDNSDDTGKIQFRNVNTLLGKCDPVVQQKWVSEVREKSRNGHSPIMFYNYSNLLFYDLIFKTFNDLPFRELNDKEAKNVFDAYLIINGVANNRIQIDDKVLKTADQNKKVEDVTIPGLIYQRDYSSSKDFQNQVARGVSLFEYLENDSKFSKYIEGYYGSKNVNGYLEMFRNLLTVFSEINIQEEERFHLLDLEKYSSVPEKLKLNFDYLETLCLNSNIESYSSDISFTILRNQMLYKIDQYKYLVLNINFFLDQFYKAQVFSFGSFIRAKGFRGEFLSEKGKNFMENIYLKSTIDSCFPNTVRFYGDDCLNSNNEELCDVYLKENNKICLVEFKDVLLNASVKNSGDREKLFLEFDKKFVSNQSNKPKGLTQLINAIKDIELNGISFDDSFSKNELEIYPIILYTDSSFGMEGINKMFNEKFLNGIKELGITLTVKDITFINLSYFELHEDYFNQNFLNLFQLLDSYHNHVINIDYSLTPFEVYSRFFMNQQAIENFESTSFQRLTERIIFS